MVHAYILIQTEVGKAASVATEVRGIGGVTEADDVTGPYDVIVRAEAKTVDDLGKLVVARIQAVEADLKYWLDHFDRHPEDRYVSDGDPATLTIPRGAGAKLRPNLPLKVIERP